MAYQSAFEVILFSGSKNHAPIKLTGRNCQLIIIIMLLIFISKFIYWVFVFFRLVYLPVILLKQGRPFTLKYFQLTTGPQAQAVLFAGHPHVSYWL